MEIIPFVTSLLPDKEPLTPHRLPEGGAGMTNYLMFIIRFLLKASADNCFLSLSSPRGRVPCGGCDGKVERGSLRAKPVIMVCSFFPPPPVLPGDPQTRLICSPPPGDCGGGEGRITAAWTSKIWWERVALRQRGTLEGVESLTHLLPNFNLATGHLDSGRLWLSSGCIPGILGLNNLEVKSCHFCSHRLWDTEKSPVSQCPKLQETKQIHSKID